MFLWSIEGKQNMHSPAHRARGDPAAPGTPHRLKYHLRDYSWPRNPLSDTHQDACPHGKKSTVSERGLYPCLVALFSCVEKNCYSLAKKL